jgi:hypothetical protein
MAAPFVAEDAPSALRRVAAILLAALLAGYVVFNKPFALTGWPPVYVGELALASGLLVLLPSFHAVFVEPVKRSWACRLIAAFVLYGSARALYDYAWHGQWALRDGVIAGYGLLAFIAPALWRPAAPDAPPLASRVAVVFQSVSLWAAVWAALIVYGYFDLRNSVWINNKPDFSTLAAALAAWLCAVAALRQYCLIRTPASSKELFPLLAGSLFYLALAVLTAKLMLRLPTRAVYLSALPLAALCLAAFARQRWQTITLSTAALLMLLLGLAGFITRYVPRFAEITRQYELNSQLGFSVRDIEIELRAHPEDYGVFNEDLNLNNISEKGFGERMASVWNPDEKQFDTLEGRRAAHAGQWRLAFWLRAFYYTMRNAPLHGIGFGTNITNLMRHSEAWEMYKPAMSMGNRNPHCAHMSVLTRMGLIGLALWAGLLGLVFWNGLKSCRRLRALGWPNAPASSTVSNISASTRQRLAFFGQLAVLGVWLIYLTTMSFGVVLENPFGGMVFWALSGVLAAGE